MKELYLVRHAKAEAPEGYDSDFERPLSKRGKKDARQIAENLKASGFSPAVLVSSPAVRALETARIFARVLGYPEDRISIHESIYDFSGGENDNPMLTVLHSLDDQYDSAMLFGHNPTIAEFACFLQRTFAGPMPTCAVVGFHLRNRTWNKVSKGRGMVVYFDYPRKAEKERVYLESHLTDSIRNQLQKIFSDADPEISKRMAKRIEKTARRLTGKFLARLEAHHANQTAKRGKRKRAKGKSKKAKGKGNG